MLNLLLHLIVCLFAFLVSCYANFTFCKFGITWLAFATFLAKKGSKGFHLTFGRHYFYYLCLLPLSKIWLFVLFWVVHRPFHQAARE